MLEIPVDQYSTQQNTNPCNDFQEFLMQNVDSVNQVSTPKLKEQADTALDASQVRVVNQLIQFDELDQIAIQNKESAPGQSGALASSGEPGPQPDRDDDGFAGKVI